MGTLLTAVFFFQKKYVVKKNRTRELLIQKIFSEGGGWYSKCSYANINGKYYPTGISSKRDGIYWAKFPADYRPPGKLQRFSVFELFFRSRKAWLSPELVLLQYERDQNFHLGRSKQIAAKYQQFTIFYIIFCNHLSILKICLFKAPIPKYSCSALIYLFFGRNLISRKRKARITSFRIFS